MSRLEHKTKNEAGQATIEAAFMIPVLLIAVLLLIQPGIIMYDRMVMRLSLIHI